MIETCCVPAHLSCLSDFQTCCPITAKPCCFSIPTNPKETDFQTGQSTPGCGTQREREVCISPGCLCAVGQHPHSVSPGCESPGNSCPGSCVRSGSGHVMYMMKSPPASGLCATLPAAASGIPCAADTEFQGWELLTPGCRGGQCGLWALAPTVGSALSGSCS